MSGVRQSIVFQIEDRYGEGNPPRTDENGISVSYWVAAPPGSYFGSTHKRDVTRVQSMGSKFWDTMAYGPLQGTWEWTFYLDYNYPEPLFLVFEGDDMTNVKTRNVLEFVKNNNKRIKSFTVRRKLLNDFIGGADNEVSILKGCVVKNATFSKPSSGSYVKVTLTGFYATEELTTMSEDEMDETDYKEYEGNLVEYGCLTSAELSDADETNASLIQNTDNVTINIDNSAEAIFSTCSPFSTEYAEGKCNITLSASSYSNHPSYYKAGVYTGGQKFNNAMDVLSSGASLIPYSKGMKPLDSAYLTSYDAMARNTKGIIGKAYAQSAATSRSSEIHLEKVVMNSLNWQKGDNGKLMDSVSGCPVRNMTIKMTTPVSQPYTESVDEESWWDLFYKTSDRREDGVKYRVNNVFVERPSEITDRFGIVYLVWKNEGYAKVHKAPDGLSGDIELLNNIVLDGDTYPVIEIERRAFDNSSYSSNRMYFTSIHIPPNIRTIGTSAFLEVTTLETVTGGTSLVDGVIDPTKGVTQIGTTAFRDCTSLASCSLLQSTDAAPVPLESIGAAAFLGCTALTEAVIPKTVTTLETSTYGSAHGTFAGCSSLVKVTLPINLSYVGKKNSTYYDIAFKNCTALREFCFTEAEDAVLYADYTPDGSKYPSEITPWYSALKREYDAKEADPSYEQQDIVIEWESIRDVPNYMFYISTDDPLRSKPYKMQPDDMAGIKYIGDRAFASCGLDVQYTETDPLTGTSLRTVWLQDVEYIGQYAFLNPLNVERIRISSASLDYIPEYMWYYSNYTNSVVSIDLGECTNDHLVVRRRSFVRVQSLERIVVPPRIYQWALDAVVLNADVETGRGLKFRRPDGSGGWVTVPYADNMVSDISQIRSDGAPRWFVVNLVDTPGPDDSYVLHYFDEYGAYNNIAMMTYGDLSSYTWNQLMNRQVPTPGLMGLSLSAPPPEENVADDVPDTPDDSEEGSLTLDG